MQEKVKKKQQILVRNSFQFQNELKQYFTQMVLMCWIYACLKRAETNLTRCTGLVKNLILTFYSKTVPYSLLHIPCIYFTLHALILFRFPPPKNPAFTSIILTVILSQNGVLLDLNITTQWQLEASIAFFFANFNFISLFYTHLASKQVIFLFWHLGKDSFSLLLSLFWLFLSNV